MSTDTNITGQTEPFVMVPNWILFHPDLTHADVRVWATLRHFWNARTKVCNPSYASIAELSRVSVSQIRNTSIRRLSEIGAIVIKPDLKGGRRTHHYHLVIDKPTARQPMDSDPDRASTTDANASTNVSPGASTNGYKQEDLEQERARDLTLVDNSVAHHWCRYQTKMIDGPLSACTACARKEGTG